ncbi:hypothetical protein [Meiothermus taiwanensis]|uniref:Uncharacterized protein n=1 Tax=Meiothermus taiwanensis WR-220 TaxID=1339250 RepID=A0ABM6WG47_9DEIN|nr:hypothetical protein [Meiothermus taiwanensis]AWR85928.1 hypothetical protein Mtai_v1c06830 [Meiothermus taiwanensis WR-220]KIQ53396.1 hypothetical protein SY28_14090 [Meiothermus taiwanensis]KZK15488.1 hypothetical protein A3962_02065 [Meiothermus taiwanensis]
MTWPKLCWILGGALALAALGVGSGLWVQSRQAAQARPPAPYRTYTATGQVVNLKALGNEGCMVQVRLHQWVSLSDGFTLAEMPQRGQLYTLGATPEQCLTLEVALASSGEREDPESPRHIYYQAGQGPGGEWRMLGSPSAPRGCGGL